MARKPLSWRVKSGEAGDFDELVVGMGGRPCLIHAEMMDERSIFVSVANLKVWAYVDKAGNAHVSMTEEEPAAPLPKGRSRRTAVHKLHDEFKPKKRTAQRQGKASDGR